MPDYDVLIIGSGFGGSVTALRLTEKGYRVGVLEAGRRFADEDFAKTSWNLRKFLRAPTLGMYGLQRLHLLPISHTTLQAASTSAQRAAAEPRLLIRPLRAGASPDWRTFGSRPR